MSTLLASAPAVTTVVRAPLDVQSAASPRPTSDQLHAFYRVLGVADAGLISRVLEPVAKLGLLPDRVHAARTPGDLDGMTVDVSLPDVSPRHAELVAFALRAIVGVRHVESQFEARR